MTSNMTPEQQLEETILEWQRLEDVANKAKEEADSLKQKAISLMAEQDLKSVDTLFGRATLAKRKKCDIIVEKKDFEQRLRQKGMYDRFCETKLSLSKVSDYVEKEDDDLYGMVELSETNVLSYRANKQI